MITVNAVIVLPFLKVRVIRPADLSAYREKEAGRPVICGLFFATYWRGLPESVRLGDHIKCAQITQEKYINCAYFMRSPNRTLSGKPREDIGKKRENDRSFVASFFLHAGEVCQKVCD